MSENESERPEVGWKYKGLVTGCVYTVTAVGTEKALATSDNTAREEVAIWLDSLKGNNYERVHPEVFPEGVSLSPDIATWATHSIMIMRFGDENGWLDVWSPPHYGGVSTQTSEGDIVNIPTETLRWMIDRVTKEDK